ncbi:hypothetical protein TKK_0001455 [Trichogramma kaykai]
MSQNKHLRVFGLDRCGSMKLIVAIISCLLIQSCEPKLLRMFQDLRTNVIRAEYNQTYEYKVDSKNQFLFIIEENIDLKHLQSSTLFTASRVVVESENATLQKPLTVVIRQKSGVISWQIPARVDENPNFYRDAHYYKKTSKLLCPSAYGDLKLEEKYATLTISTESADATDFKLNLVKMKDFDIGIGENRTFNITPAESNFYSYRPDEDHSTVLIEVSSDSPTCMTISIQKPLCPVFDSEEDIHYDGYRQTVSTKGGLTVSSDNYPDGFFIVFVLNADDSSCIRNSSNKDINNRSKLVSFNIQKGISKKDYAIASLITVVSLMLFCAAFFSMTILCKFHDFRAFQRRTSTSSRRESDPAGPEEMGIAGSNEVATSNGGGGGEDNNAQDDEIDTAVTVRTSLSTKRPKLAVTELSKKGSRKIHQDSWLFMYYLLTVAIFYAAPVIQLVVTDQIMLHVTGNQDLCYYNFLCSHPLMSLSDFNHVLSNLGYVMLGLLFMTIVYTRQRKNANLLLMHREYGIPPHYGLYYAMGFALVMEGIMSGSYHVCPSHSTFQFDTSFMYIMAVLSIVKIYQNRHPDVNAEAPTIFGILSITILFVIIGVLKGDVIYFWIIFSIIHLGLCIFLSVQIYYVGRCKFDKTIFRRMAASVKNDVSRRRLFRPLHWKRFFLLIVGNLCNFGLAIYGNVNIKQDFAKYLLTILLLNLLLYMLFYTTLKIHYKEKILLQTKVYIVIAMLTWAAAMYFFLNKTTSWSKTPAQSRTYNQACVLKFYDFHDIWHILSAISMFFSFMMLLTLDDDLINTHRSLIPVF